MMCAAEACEVVDTLQLEGYQATACGVTSDKSRQKGQILMVAVFYALTATFMAIRFVSRFQLNVGVGLDDWMILAAFAAYTTSTTMSFLIPLNGFGEHTYFLRPEQTSTSLMVRSLHTYDI